MSTFETLAENKLAAELVLLLVLTSCDGTRTMVRSAIEGDDPGFAISALPQAVELMFK